MSQYEQLALSIEQDLDFERDDAHDEVVPPQKDGINLDLSSPDPRLIAERSLQGFDETTVAVLRKLGLATDFAVNPLCMFIAGAGISSSEDQKATVYSLFMKDKGHVYDDGTRLHATKGTGHEVQAMIELAKVKGWDGLKVTGPRGFQLQVFIAAAEAGIKVKDFRPTAEEATLIEEITKARLKAGMSALSKAGKEAKKQAVQQPVQPATPTVGVRLGAEPSDQPPTVHF